jgi:hypothetical protein
MDSGAVVLGLSAAGLGQTPSLQSEAVPTLLWWAFGTGLLLSLILGRAERLSLRRFSPMLRTSRVSCAEDCFYSYTAWAQVFLVLVGTAAGGLLERLDCSRFGRLIDLILSGSLLLLGFYLLWRI